MKTDAGDFASFGSDYHTRFRTNLYTRIFGVRGPLLRLIRARVRTGRLLDIGCGQGAWLADAARHFHVSGCDTSEFALEQARKRIPTAEAFVKVDANDPLPFESGSFDAVTTLDVVEHLHSPETLIAEAVRMLRPGGIFALTTPNPRCASALRFKPEDWHGARDTTHITLRPVEFWEELLRAGGIQPLDVRFDGLWDVPYSKLARKHRVAQLFEHAFVQLPSVLAYNAGVRIPEAYGENILIIGRKPGG